MLQLVDPKLIKPNPYQPRQQMDKAKLAELAASIKAEGLLQPPQARRVNGHYELVFGHRRFAAWQTAKGKEKFPVEVVEASDRQMFDRAIAENDARENLNPIERAEAIQNYIDTFKVSQAEAGKVFGLKSQGAVSNVLRLLKLPKEVRALVAANELTERQARQFITAGLVVPGKELATLAKNYAAETDEDERQNIIDGELTDAIVKHSKPLGRMVGWPMDWPSQPLPVNPPVDEVAEVPACEGCQFAIQIGYRGSVCVRPTCWNIKSGVWEQEALKLASVKVHLPVATPEQATSVTTEVVFDGEDWNSLATGRKLLDAPNRSKDLGLVLVPNPKGNTYFGNDLLGYKGVALATTNPKAVQAYLKATKLDPKGNGKNLSPEKLKQLEESNQAEADRERGAVRRAEADITWLILNTAQLIADRLDIPAPVAAWLGSNIVCHPGDHAAIKTRFNELANEMWNLSGKEALAKQRLYFALCVLVESAIDQYSRIEPDTVPEVLERVREVVGAGNDDSEWGGLNLKLPAGWDEIPIHRTEANCWNCGRFAPKASLSKRDMEAGWSVLGRGQETLSVTCPDCKNTDLPTPTPTKKGKSKK